MFLALHQENTSFMRGFVPAVWPRDDASPDAIIAARERVDEAAGRAGSAAGFTNAYFNVQGAGIVDPIASWHTITQPKPLLEPENILSACGLMLGRLDEKIAAAEAGVSPGIDPETLHPLVWGAARSLWRDEHYRLAVVAAAEAIVGQLKTRTGRNDKSDTALWQETFSDAPPLPGKPRLRWPGDPYDQTVKSMNAGLRQLAPGLQLTIRNVATHNQTELRPADAMERIAALSLLAKWGGALRARRGE